MITAIELSNEKGTVGLIGFRGGRLAKVDRYNVNVEYENIQQFEDVHMVLGHLIFRHLMGSIKGSNCSCNSA